MPEIIEPLSAEETKESSSARETPKPQSLLWPFSYFLFNQSTPETRAEESKSYPYLK